MVNIIIRIYETLRRRPWLGIGSFLLLTALLALSLSRLTYKEDIADFLPVDSRHQEAMRVYQDIAGAGRVFAVFQYRDTTKADPDHMVEAIEAYVEELQGRDTLGMARELTAQVDIAKLSELTDFVYQNIPYFLTAADYQRMDSLLAQPGFIKERLADDKQMLLFPSGGILADNISRDPLNLFTPVVQQLQRGGDGLNYEMYDGYIFSPDMQRAIVMVNSPYGSSETEHNAQLVQLLDSCAKATEANVENIEIHTLGGPVIAVGNASQIKGDSLLGVSLAVVLILALLFASLRSVRNLSLLAVSIGWGWLFAMGMLAVVHSSVSIIVIGISSVIVGIAVNYPLHFIAHLSHTPSKRSTLREIVAPLVVGNVTTVGAFLALVPLESVALRDLGLFSSLLLVGTILFTLLYLPHVAKVKEQRESGLISRLGRISLENKPWLVGVVAVLTLVLGWFSLQTSFDSNMAHINYMTDEQRADMAYFQRMMTTQGNHQTVYALSADTTMDAALDRSRQLQPAIGQLENEGKVVRHGGCKQFLCSEKEQAERLAQWCDFVSKHKQLILSQLTRYGAEEGFADGSFQDFADLLTADYQVQSIDHFAPLAKATFSANLSSDTARHIYNVVDVLTVRADDVEAVEAAVERVGGYGFDVGSMNGAIANALSDNFNYIGIACGCIVFFFLWLSFGSIELAVLSFIPMAVSWLWILGIMALCGIQFNIVNVILATFIFGQGDDYTIFMTEGACYEYAYRRQMLASYKHSIILSALIMFIGIGTLVLAKHPALRSLAQVTMAGMFSVVLMAYLFPPLIFGWLVKDRQGNYRRRPLSVSLLWEKLATRKDGESKPDGSPHAFHNLVRDRYRYKGVDVYREVCRNLRRTHDYAAEIAALPEQPEYVVENGGYGEKALLIALTHQRAKVVMYEKDEDKATVARYSAEGIVGNLEIKNMDIINR